MEGERPRVLVIDDDPKIARVIERALAVEYEVVALTCAAEGLARIEAGERFDVILCDLLLPGVDGVAFHERLRDIAPDLCKRLLIMTGGAFTARTKAFLRRADVRHVEKPFASLAELREAVRQHVRRLDTSHRQARAKADTGKGHDGER